MSLLIKGIECNSLHFVGILGAGMSAIAQYLKWDSLNITGSDRLKNSESTKNIQDKLTDMDCKIYNQDGSGITNKCDAIVLSSAIEDSNPDIKRAKTLKIPLLHRSEVLAAIVGKKMTIAIAGSSGKSTVTALLFHLLHNCNKNPSLITGANLNFLTEKGLIGNAYHGSSDILIIEADESDGTLVNYKPAISLFLNLSKDHKPIDEILPLFLKLANQSSYVFTNRDNECFDTLPHTNTFGMDKSSDFYPDLIESKDSSISITRDNIRFSVPFPGLYMAFNLIAALSICDFLECDPIILSKVSKFYTGIGRRFNKLETKNKITVIDDYAHNPEKIYAVLKTVQNLSKRVFALFQPHGFGPTKFLFNEFVSVFKETLRKDDFLFVLPIYYAGGTVKKDISSQDIKEALKNCPGTIISPEKREFSIPKILSEAKSGDIIISMGARDPSLPMFAKEIANAINGV